MPMFVSQNGNASVNLNDRVSALRVHHHKFAFVWEYDAANAVFFPRTNLITVFVSGIDDTTTTPWAQAGYSTATVPNNSIDVTSTYKGGAFSITDPVIVLSVGIMPEQTIRILPTASGTSLDSGTPQVTRQGGTITDISAQMDDFWGNMVHQSFVNILPPGNNTMCSGYIGLPQMFNSGMGQSNSPNLSTPGQNRPEARYTFGTEVFVEPNLRNMGDFNPNRLQFTFGPAGTVAAHANTAVLRTAKIPALTAPADTDLAVLDVIVSVEYARVKFSADGSSYEGVEEIDKRKIAMFRGENSFCGI